MVVDKNGFQIDFLILAKKILMSNVLVLAPRFSDLIPSPPSIAEAVKLGGTSFAAGWLQVCKSSSIGVNLYDSQ